MNPPQRFLPYEPLQAFDAEREHGERQRPLLPVWSRADAGERLRVPTLVLILVD
jgi:hypothetical protein